MSGRLSVLLGTGFSRPEKRLPVSSTANGIKLSHYRLFDCKAIFSALRVTVVVGIPVRSPSATQR